MGPPEEATALGWTQSPKASSAHLGDLTPRLACVGCSTEGTHRPAGSPVAGEACPGCRCRSGRLAACPPCQPGLEPLPRPPHRGSRDLPWPALSLPQVGQQRFPEVPQTGQPE